MQRAIKLGILGAVVALLASVGLFTHGGGTTPASAQVVFNNCATLGGGGEQCSFTTAVAINDNSTINPATITIAVTSPSGVNVVTASAGGCTVTSGANTPTLTLTCTFGLFSGANVSVTFSQALHDIITTVTYNANQTAQSNINLTTNPSGGALGSSGCVVSPSSVTYTNAVTPAAQSFAWSCTNTTTAAVQPGNTLTMTIGMLSSCSGGAGACLLFPAVATGNYTAQTSTGATCPMTSHLGPGTLHAIDNPALTLVNETTETWICGVSQNIAAGTSIAVAGNSNDFPYSGVECSGYPCTVTVTGFELTTMNANCPATGTSVQPSPCAAYAGSSSQSLDFQNASIASTATPTPTGTTTPGCGPASYGSGWNLAGGPSGTVLTGATSLFSLPTGATSYTELPTSTPLTAPNGYWAFFSSAASVSQPCVAASSTSVALGANQIQMEGDPFNVTAFLSASGATSYAITFNTASNSFGSWTRIDSGGSMPLNTGAGAFGVAIGGSATLNISTSAPPPPIPTP
jgi:hypothetical protein